MIFRRRWRIQAKIMAIKIVVMLHFYHKIDKNISKKKRVTKHNINNSKKNIINWCLWIDKLLLEWHLRKASNWKISREKINNSCRKFKKCSGKNTTLVLQKWMNSNEKLTKTKDKNKHFLANFKSSRKWWPM